MRAVTLHRTGDPATLRVEDAADPQPSAGEVIVQLRAAALNHRDVFICRGQYAGLRFPVILGSDGVGEVVALGAGVADVQVGDPVVIYPCLDWGADERVQGPQFRILGMPDDGTFAELVRVPAANIFPRPAGLSDAEAAAIPLAGLTAYRALASRGDLQPEERVLITGIGGGVATLALLIARRLGARVVVTSGSEEKLERARALGAEAGVNYRSGDWVAAVRAATDGGPDLVIDGVGGVTLDQAMDAVRPGGRVVSYGATTGVTPQLTVRRIFWKQLSVVGSTMGSPRDFRGMLDLFEGGAIRPVVDRVYPLAEAGAALARLESGEQFGKIVLDGAAH